MASTRLPQALIDRVEDWATTSGASRSGAIRKSSRTAGVLVARAGRVAPARAIEGQQETRRRVDEVVAPFWEVTWAKLPNSTSETGTAPSISIPSTMRQERNRLCAIELRRLDASTPIFFRKNLSGRGWACRGVSSPSPDPFAHAGDHHAAPGFTYAKARAPGEGAGWCLACQATMAG